MQTRPSPSVGSVHLRHVFVQACGVSVRCSWNSQWAHTGRHWMSWEFDPGSLSGEHGRRTPLGSRGPQRWCAPLAPLGGNRQHRHSYACDLCGSSLETSPWVLGVRVVWEKEKSCGSHSWEATSYSLLECELFVIYKNVSADNIGDLMGLFIAGYSLPNPSQGRGSLVGCRLWGRIESDTTEAT